MSWRHNLQSNEIDSVNWATSGAGPPENRPLRDTGEYDFIELSKCKCAPDTGKCQPFSTLSFYRAGRQELSASCRPMNVAAPHKEHPASSLMVFA